jgi:hypothetical protein
VAKPKRAYVCTIAPSLQTEFQRSFPGCFLRSYLIKEGRLSFDIFARLDTNLYRAGFVTIQQFSNLPPCGIRRQIGDGDLYLHELHRQKRGTYVKLCVEADNKGAVASLLRQIFNVDAARVERARPILRLVVNNG